MACLKDAVVGDHRRVRDCHLTLVVVRRRHVPKGVRGTPNGDGGTANARIDRFRSRKGTRDPERLHHTPEGTVCIEAA